MRSGHITLFFLGLLISFFAQADELKGYQIQNCNYWVPSQSGRGFVCASQPIDLNVAEAHTFAAEIRRLQTLVEHLEKRIQQLENKPQPN